MDTEKGVIPENVYRSARLSHGLSQAKLAELANVSRLSILRLEQGLFAEPLGKVSLALGLSHSDARESYYAFQTASRQVAKHPPILSSDSFPTWRERNWPSQASFCVDYCVAQASLHRYESVPTAIMPAQLRDALADAGYNSISVKSLERNRASIA